jgi:hypothetical protein
VTVSRHDAASQLRSAARSSGSGSSATIAHHMQRSRASGGGSQINEVRTRAAQSQQTNSMILPL